VNYDKLYDQILARKETRESSTLTMISITSSASLVLLVIFLQPTSDQNQLSDSEIMQKFVVKILGILFPLIAILYREITYHYIQAHDNEVLNAILFKELSLNKEQKQKIEDSILYKEKRGIRLFLLRFLITLPALGWLLVSDPFIGGVISLIILMIIIAFSLRPRFSRPKINLPDL